MTVFTPRNPLLSDILSLHGRWHRTREAVICGDERLNWEQLDLRLNRFANASLNTGLRSGEAIAVMMGNGLPMLEVLFGAMKTGLTSVPLNLSITNEAAANMIADAGVRAIICTPDQSDRIEADEGLISATKSLARICTEARKDWLNYADWVSAANTARPDIKIDSDQPLNIIYSSGTTGTPKGIVHTQQGRKDWASDLAVALRYHGGARTLITLGMYSNISWVSMLCTALAGGTLVIEDKFDACRFWDIVETERITHTSMVPIQYDRIMQADTGTRDISSIQAMMSAGSPLYPELKSALLDRFGPTIIELYGLTEGVITILDPEDADGRMASVGQPLIGTDIRVIDDEDHEVTPGQAGEIVATGRIVMPGYHNRREATLEASWAAPDGSVWMRTGDIGRVDEDGFLYIVDRKKDMILSGGQNIYPQDIEARLVSHPDIAEAAVIAAQSTKWGETPLALVVMRNGKASPETLKKWCNEGLGRQQRIAELIIVDELPRNPNGKLLKLELRKQFKDRIYG